ncbi:hypothetical protein THIOM_001969 [Candidatus Thiomargarita nelsonii]|uniref:Uncharacterized protein n=1 Tax=Candidatus Thiomargarita nelsonii TaxID=1003181 RepID=A0A176S2R7_9GAMM|nr:hypothetical protein THIOM_001969 [Candidatus Thiomargarita nelsonii]
MTYQRATLGFTPGFVILSRYLSKNRSCALIILEFFSSLCENDCSKFSTYAVSKSDNLIFHFMTDLK